MQEYEINSAIAIINKKQNSMDEEKLMQYMLKKGFKHLNNLMNAGYMELSIALENSK